MRITLTALMILVVPAYAGDDHAAIRSGRTFVEKNCSPCHAVGSTGESPHPDAPAFRSLSTRYPLANLEESLAEGILTGHPDMPEFKVQPKDISDIIRYLNSIQK